MSDGESRWSAAPPGWYPDPKRLPRERYFDGCEWTSSVRDGNGLTSDPMGPLPMGRDAWIAPEVLQLLHRPAVPTWWHRHRNKVRIGLGLLLVVALVVAVVVRPRALGTLALAAAAVGVMGLGLWSALNNDQGSERPDY